MKIIASWNYSEDLDNLEKALVKAYSSLIPEGYKADKNNKTPLALVKDDVDRKSGYISYVVSKGEFKQEIASKLDRKRVISLLNTYFSDYLVTRLAATTDKDGEYYNFELRIKLKGRR